MNRQAFLSSMPFLLPCPSAAWPPRRSTSSTKSTRVETLLQVSPDSSYKFKLSLEPAIATCVEGRHKLEKIQPAFFGRPVDEGNAKSNNDSIFDPSLADVQVAVESSSAGYPNDSQDDASVLKGRVLFLGGDNNANNDSASTHTSSTHKMNPDKLPSFQRPREDWPLFLYFRIDREGVFQVDGKQILHVELIPTEHSGNDNNDGKSKPALPPSLLLVFSCCCFRIFPLYCPNSTKVTAAADSDPPKKEWMEESLEALRMLEKHVLQVATNGASNAAWSPCGSSVPSGTAEAGQKDGGYPTPWGQSNSHSHSTLTTSSNSSSRSQTTKKLKANEDADDVKLQENHLIRKSKRRRDALARSRAGMRSVEIILDMPVSVCKLEQMLQPKKTVQHNLETQAVVPLTDSATSDVGMPKTQGHLGPHNNKHPNKPGGPAMGPLLTGITEDLMASYGSQAETQEILQLYQREIEERRCRDMDELLDSFFPGMPQRQNSSRKSSKSRGRAAKTNDGGNADAEACTKSAEDVMKSVQRLIEKQKTLVEERISFLELPTRG